MWQPIETAPKDKYVLLFCWEDKSIWLGKWQGRHDNAEWYGVDDEGLTRSSSHYAVTHWMPLPEPPAA